MTVGNLRRFRVVLIGPTYLVRNSRSGVGCADRDASESPWKALGVRSCRCYVFGCKWEVVAILGGDRMARGWWYTKQCLSNAPLCTACVCASSYICFIYGFPERPLVLPFISYILFFVPPSFLLLLLPCFCIHALG